MKKNLLLVMAGLGCFGIATNSANAQDAVVVEEESVTYAVSDDAVDCKDNYYSTWHDNWFIQLGAGVNVPFVEYAKQNGDPKHHFTATYNLGFGKWMSPYLGWRISMYYGSIHWDNEVFSKAKMANANFDLMWDMCNSIAGANPNRPVSIVPFVGLGGTFTWDFKAPSSVIYKEGMKLKHNAWTLPVSAGIQVRFRLCEYVDFFLEGRASFYGDNFNLAAFGDPVDVDITAIGGFNINIGGSNFKTYNPCKDQAYINSLNGQINSLRGDLAATATALAAAESQLPCPEAQVVESQTIVNGPLLTTVRFSINSAKVSDEEMVNVYNVAEYLKSNPSVNVIICGYADKDTGTAAYNMDLSQRRAQAVYDLLTKTYGIDKDRLAMQAEGSDTQVYKSNDWNRIVIFVPAE